MDFWNAGLDRETLEALEAQRAKYREAFELIDAAIYRRLGRRDDPTFVELEQAFVAAADPETNEAFRHGQRRGVPHLRSGAAPPTPVAVERTAAWMVAEGWDERTVAEVVFQAATERGLDEEQAVEHTARGLRQARESSPCWCLGPTTS